MADITLTSSIRSNLLSLQNTAKLLDLTANRLSTGKKVNSALDNPSSFFAARGLSNRATDLTGLKDGIAQGIQTLKTADKALSSITNLVEQAKSLATQAKEAAASNTVSKLSAAITTTTITGGDTLSTALGITAASTITFEVGATGLTLTVTAGETLTAVVAKLNSFDSGITASYDSATKTFDVSMTAGEKLTVSTITEATIFSATTGTPKVATFGTGASGDVAGFAADYDKVMTQLNALVNNGDTSYKGINLLKTTDLTVKLSENDSSLTVKGVDATTNGLQINATATWATVDGQVDTDIALIDGAIAKLRTYASSFGTDLSILQYREDYTSELVNTLQDGAGQLTNANLEEEAANLLALQTRQSLGTQSLSISNQSQQSILSLFR